MLLRNLKLLIDLSNITLRYHMKLINDKIANLSIFCIITNDVLSQY
jgi:hypothetical protein